MKNLKIAIVAVSILIMGLICIGIFVINLDEEKKEEIKENEIKQEQNNNPKSMESVKDAQEFYTVERIILGYIYNINNRNVDNLFLQLYPKYINEFNITRDNVIEKLDDVIDGKRYYNDIALSIEINKMFYVETVTNIRIYFVKASLIDNMESTKKEFQIVLYVDSQNKSYYVLPNEYIEKHQLSESKDDINNYDFSIEDIPVTGSNSYIDANVKDSEIILEYIERFKNKIIDDIEGSYDLINNNYKNARFDNIESYKEYINKNMIKIQRLSIDGYQKKIDNNVTRYILKDNSDNIYIIEETSIMNFTIYLDAYTVDTPEFLEKYTKANEQKKVMMNIDKWIQMLNNRDYTAAYKVLDETFRNNNFGLEQNFEKYMREHYPLHYKIEFVSFSEEANTYIQKIRLKDITGQNEEQKEINIIMQLKEETDFVMSFGIE